MACKRNAVRQSYQQGNTVARRPRELFRGGFLTEQPQADATSQALRHSSVQPMEKPHWTRCNTKAAPGGLVQAALEMLWHSARPQRKFLAWAWASEFPWPCPVPTVTLPMEQLRNER